MPVRVFVTTLALFACGTLPGFAQDPGRSPLGLSALRTGDPVIVTRTSAPKVKGLVTGVTDAELTVQDDEGPRRIPVTAVQRIWQDDPLWNGTLIGAGVGAAAMGVMVGDCKRHDSECRAVATGIGLIVTGGMAVLGATVDHFTRRLIYEKPGLHASVAAVAAPRGAGVAMRLRF